MSLLLNEVESMTRSVCFLDLLFVEEIQNSALQDVSDEYVRVLSEHPSFVPITNSQNLSIKIMFGGQMVICN
jgi:hypothetical protein